MYSMVCVKLLQLRDKKEAGYFCLEKTERKKRFDGTCGPKPVDLGCNPRSQFNDGHDLEELIHLLRKVFIIPGTFMSRIPFPDSHLR